MKNKSMTYLLIAGVLAVWGIVFYRIYASVAKDESQGNQAVAALKPIRNEEQEDTFVLLANYRDPFLGTSARAEDPTAKKVSRSLPSGPKKPEVQIDWSFIDYNGSVYNKASKKTVSLLTIRGQSCMLNEKDSSNQVTLLKNFGDSVLVAFSGKKKVIRLNEKITR